MNGFWVVFEDIDKAPSDIISILLPLLEGAVTFSTGHGEVYLSFVSNIIDNALIFFLGGEGCATCYLILISVIEAAHNFIA